MGAALSSSESIKDEDVLYMDDNVCILKPTVKKGIIVRTHYTQPDGESLCDVGLKTGEQLKDEGVDFGRNIFHPYHFFRAPYYSGEIDYSTLETEISSSYGEGQLGITKSIYIRVDPDRTFVFSSEIRVEIPPAHFHVDGHQLTPSELGRTHMDNIMNYSDSEHLRQQYLESEIEKSRKTLTAYLNIIKANKAVLPPSPPPAHHPATRVPRGGSCGVRCWTRAPRSRRASRARARAPVSSSHAGFGAGLADIHRDIYNLYTSKKVIRPVGAHSASRPDYPYNDMAIEINSEILVSIGHLTPEYFVHCTRSN